ncbi:hypothetical protein OG900_09125 [Streptomyces sp. NBC_00433]
MKIRHALMGLTAAAALAVGASAAPAGADTPHNLGTHEVTASGASPTYSAHTFVPGLQQQSVPVATAALPVATAVAVTASGATTSSAVAASACQFTPPYVGAPTGVYKCGSNVERFAWTDGRVEYSVLGTDAKVWDTWWNTSTGTWSSWTSMGAHDILNGVWGANIALPLATMQVRGSDNNYWCRTYNGGWGSWYICN